MDEPFTVVFRERYESLKSIFEARLAGLADAVRSAVECTRNDQVLLELNANENTRQFAPAHARTLIKRHLASERDAYFHGLAARLADAETKVIQCSRRNEELESTVALLRGDAARNERSRIEAAAVNADVQQLRREYQISLEASTAECRQLKAELSHAKRRSGELKAERDEQAAKTRSLQKVSADSRVTELEVVSLERELEKEKSANIKLSSELEQTQQKLEGLASNHQKLQFQAQSLQNDLRQRDRRLQLADVNRKKSEAQFREAVARMESLLEQEARDSTSIIKNLRDKNELARGKLSAEVERQSAVNRQLTDNLASAKTERVELELRLQAELKSKEMDLSAAVARERVLRAEAEQARTRADAMSQSLAEAVREQSGMVTETANAKVAAQILEEKNRAAEVEMARAAGLETGRAHAGPHDCILSTVPGPGWEVDSLLAEKLQEASSHISELRAVLRQEVRRREIAEAEVSEAQGYLNSSRQELGELRHLAWKLEQMGRNSIADIDEKNLAIKHLDEAGAGARGGESEEGIEAGIDRMRRRESAHRGRHSGRQISPNKPGSRVEVTSVCGEGDGLGPERRATMQRTMSNSLSSNKGGQRLLLTALSGLRTELQCVNTQLGDTKAKSEELVRHCTEGVALRVERLTRTLQQTSQKQVEAQRQASQATAAAAGHKETSDALRRLVQGISAILLDSLGVPMPACLSDTDAAGKEPEGALERGLSELATAVAQAVSSLRGITQHSLPVEAHRDSSALVDGRPRSPTLDGMIWGERSKDDFNMLAQLQKIEAESELQSLQARLDDMTAKYSRAVAENGTVDSAPLREERERAKEELARAARVHNGAISALEVALSAEKSHCQDLRMRLERQARQHEAALDEADQRLLNTQQDLDKTQQALEHAKFALERETARRARLEKKYSELEDRGLVSPRSVSPRVWRPDAATRKASAQPDARQVVQPTLSRPSSARLVLEEARAKLGQDGDVPPAAEGGPDLCVGRRGKIEELHESTSERDPGSGSRRSVAEQIREESVSPL